MDRPNPYASPVIIDSDAGRPITAEPLADWPPRAVGPLGSLAIGLTLALVAEIVLYTLRAMVPYVPSAPLYLACRFCSVAGGAGIIAGLIGLGNVPRVTIGRASLYAGLALAILSVVLEGAVICVWMGWLADMFSRWSLYVGWLAGYLALLFAGITLGKLATQLRNNALTRWYQAGSLLVVVFIVSDLLYMLYIWSNQATSSETAFAVVRVVVVSAIWAIYAIYLRLALGLRNAAKILGARYQTGSGQPVELIGKDSASALWLKERSRSLWTVAQGMTAGKVGVFMLAVAVLVNLWSALAPELPWRQQLYHVFWLAAVSAEAIKVFAAQRWSAVPEASKARRLAQAATVVALIGLLSTAAEMLADWRLMSPLGLPNAFIRLGLEIIGILVAITCLKRILTFIGRPDLRRWAEILLLLALGLAVADGLALLLMASSEREMNIPYMTYLALRAIVIYAEIPFLVLCAVFYSRARSAMLEG